MIGAGTKNVLRPDRSDVVSAGTVPVLENGRFSDRNRIGADSRVSNRIEIGRNK